MSGDLVFGWRTALLAVAFGQLVILSIALTRPIRNRVGNRTLAVLLILLAGMITPWMIGFAGFYDRWRWLSFAPFAISLGIAPLVYLYVHALVFGGWPARSWRHLAAPVLQFAYLLGAFVLLRDPLKNWWLGESSPVYDVVTGAGVVIGLAAYGVACWRLVGSYRTFLSRQRSDDHRFALRWLQRTAGALFLLFGVWAIYTVWDLFAPLGYSGLMGLYVAIAAFALFLGIEGWRHSATPFPIYRDDGPVSVEPDWVARGHSWAERVRRERLYADPELSVPRLARILGTNSAYVSRAFNEGLGQSFSSFINGLRCEDVARMMADDRSADLLGLALDSGFSSKASFNRAFRARFGCSPSAYRREGGAHSK